MSWSPITPDEIDLLPDEREALESLDGSTDILPAILTRTVNAVRGSIIAGGNRLGPEGTIPDQLKQEVIDITRWVWITSFPELKQLATDARQRLHDAARKTLRDVASGEIKIEIPAEALTTPSPKNASVIVRPGRFTSAQSMDLTGTT